MLLALIAFLGGARALAAQTPNLWATVSSLDGKPIVGAEVRLRGTRAVTRTETDGSFAFKDVADGVATLYIERTGFLPLLIQLMVPDSSRNAMLTMVETTPALDSLKLKKGQFLLAGVVLDSLRRPIEHAMVEVVGGGQTDSTDANGRFALRDVKEGTVVYRVRRRGYYAETLTAALHESRGEVVRMHPLADKLSESKQLEEAGFGADQGMWHDARMRFVQRSINSAIVPREELAPLGNQSLRYALGLAPSSAYLRNDVFELAQYACIFLNGERTLGPAGLDGIRASDIEFVEVYPPGSENSGTLARLARGAGCPNVARRGLRARAPFYVVVWER